jgi:glycosyltransferase involved in cell wall biosynthesis
LLDAPLVGPRVLSIVGDESGCSLWRAWQPARFLRLHGYPCDWVHVRDPSLINVPLEGYEAIVLCRLAWHRTDRKRAGRWLDTLRRQGRRVFFEADDDLFTPFMTEQQLGRINPEKSRQELEADRAAALWALERCDGVTVSTQYLASTVRRYTSAPVEVVPNAVDAEWFLARQRGVPRPCPNVTVGWAGGNRPDADLEEMAVAWGRIARRYPEVMFVVFGHQPPVISRHVPDERVIRISWLPMQEYPRGMVGIDVGCCPLAETPFNRSKTPIKAWELALSGAAVVASPTVYGKVIADEGNGFLAANADAWESCLEYLVGRPAWRGLAAENLKRDVLERWSLKANYWRWPAAWHRLMQRAEGRA